MQVDPRGTTDSATRSDAPDLSEFAVVIKGNLYEDFSIDQEFVHHWGRTITDADNALFCSATCHWNPLGLNVEYARAHGHPDVVVNPMLIACIVVSLSVEDLSEAGGPFLGVDSCVFHRPCYPGDTLHARSTVLAKRTSSSRPDTGIVTWRTEGYNQDGNLVVELERTNLVRKRRQ